MYGITEEQWSKWTRKRRHTMIGFVIIGTAVGIDCSVVFSTLYLYLRDNVHTKDPQMWYGLVIAFFFISATASGIISGRWLDRTRRVRAYVNMNLLIQATGFIVYAIPLHPVFLLVGRTICGMGEPFSSVVSGEVMRIHDEKGRTRGMLLLASVYSFGFIIGPLFNFIFTKVEFRIGPIHIDYTNFIGIFMAGVLFLLLIVANFLVHDCSSEFDLKEYLQNEGRNINGNDSKCDVTYSTLADDVVISNKATEETGEENTYEKNGMKRKASSEENNDTTVYIKNNDDIISTETKTLNMSSSDDDYKGQVTMNPTNQNVIINDATATEEKNSIKLSTISKEPINKDLPQLEVLNEPSNTVVPVSIVLKTLTSNNDTLLILVSTFIFIYTIFTSTALISLICEITLKWSLHTLSIVFAAYGVVDFIFLSLMAKFCTSNRSVYILSLVAILSQILGCVMFILLNLLARHIVRDIIIITVYLVCNIIGWCLDDVLIRVLFANLVPSKIQSFSETLRAGMCKLAMIGASFSMTSLLSWLHWWSVGAIVLLIVLLVGFIVRKKYLINPKEVPFLEKDVSSEDVRS